MEPMQITITGTTVNITGDRIIGFALNNLVNTFTATTDLTSEWSYQLYVHMVVPDLYNIINLNWEENTQNIYVDLTADMLPYSGRYEMQFVATNGDYVSHTDIFEVFVKNTLNPVKQYTPVPSEFYQIQKDVQQNAQLAQNSANQAEQSAIGIEGYATSAQQAAQDASGYLAQVQQSASEAEQSASQAAESATQAQQLATTSQQSATSASESASEASISATAAQNAQQAIENMTVSATTLPPGSDANVVKTTDQGVVNLEFGIPHGEQGDAGGYYIPSVDSMGELSWQPSIDTMPSVSSSNIMGPEYTLTSQDKQEIVQEVINSLPVYNGEVQDIV